MVGTVDDGSRRVKRSAGGVVAGILIGSVAGAVAGFLVGGPVGAGAGLIGGASAGIGIGQLIPSRSDKGQYQLSSLEKGSLVG